MHRNLGLFLAFAGFSTAVSAGGLAMGALDVGITIRASCEVGSQPVGGGYQVENRNCVGAGRFRVLQQVGSNRTAFDLQPQSTLILAAHKAPTVVTFYW
jgi:hypothetical protein